MNKLKAILLLLISNKYLVISVNDASSRVFMQYPDKDQTEIYKGGLSMLIDVEKELKEAKEIIKNSVK